MESQELYIKIVAKEEATEEQIESGEVVEVEPFLCELLGVVLTRWDEIPYDAKQDVQDALERAIDRADRAKGARR